MLAALPLVVGVPTYAQTFSPVFTDNFQNGSTVGGTSIPGGSPTASFTSYDIASSKNASASAISSNALRVTFPATTSGFAETQAVFSSTPITLQSVGDAINMQVTFVNVSNILSGSAGTSAGLFAGLYDSGTSAPLTNLASSGLSATAGSPNATGGTQLWQGYVQKFSIPGGSNTSYVRPQQTGTNTSSANQDLIGNNFGGGAYTNPTGAQLTNSSGTLPTQTLLTVGGTYTLDYTLTLVDSSTISLQSSLYDGVGTGGTAIASLTRLATGTSLVTSQFSGLAFGVRYSGSNSGAITMDINSITIQATTGAPPPPSVITINVASGTQTQTEAGYALLSGTVPVHKTGAGTLVLDQANTLSGSTSVQGGTLQLASFQASEFSTIVPVAGGTVSLAPYLTTVVGGLDPNAGGLTDVGNGLVTVSSGLTAANMVTAIVAGMGDGSWNGTTGITSSAAAADAGLGVSRAVGWLDNGDGTVTFAYAAPGDTNLDWSIDLLDIGTYLAAGKYDTGEPSSWSEGDYTYDGLVDITDVALYLGTGLFDIGPYNPPAGTAGGVAAVPEPVMTLAGVMAMAGSVALARRRLA